MWGSFSFPLGVRLLGYLDRDVHCKWEQGAWSSDYNTHWDSHEASGQARRYFGRGRRSSSQKLTGSWSITNPTRTNHFLPCSWNSKIWKHFKKIELVIKMAPANEIEKKRTSVPLLFNWQHMTVQPFYSFSGKTNPEVRRDSRCVEDIERQSKARGRHDGVGDIRSSPP